MPVDMPPELAINLAYYRTPDAVAAFSVYRLYPDEEQLLPRYYSPGENVLDLACGLGRTTLMLHEMGMAVRGYDRSDIFVEVAQRRFPYLDIRQGSYDHIEEPDESFKHVLISHNGIDYAFPVSQRLAALKECARVLKPEGTLIFSSHNIKSLHLVSPYYNRGGRLRWKLRNCLRAFRQEAYIREDGEYALYSMSDNVVRQTEKTGLKLVEIQGFNRFSSKSFDRCFSPYLSYVFRKGWNTAGSST